MHDCFTALFGPLTRQQDFAHYAQAGGTIAQALQDCASIMPLSACHQAQQYIRQWPQYQPTPLVPLTRLANMLGVHSVYCKDESLRFGLGSFKALGGAYAVFKLASEHYHTPLDILLASMCKPSTQHTFSWRDRALHSVPLTPVPLTIVTATDGNHGRSVAWGAQKLGLPCKIYMHAGVSSYRADYVRSLGAEVVCVSGNYDASVDQAAQDAKKNPGWQVVSDTSYPGYTAIPADIMHGYSMMAAEIITQIPHPPSHVFICGGCGGLAAAMIGYMAQYWLQQAQHTPRWIIIEPSLAPSLRSSAIQQQAIRVDITKETLMAGLSCGEMSLIAFEVMRHHAIDYLLIDDHWVTPIMQLLAAEGLLMGETAVATPAGLVGSALAPDLRAKLKLDAQSTVLLFGTEGVTDPNLYQDILGFANTALPAHQASLAQKIYGHQ